MRSSYGGLSTPGGKGLKHYASVRLELKKKWQGEIKAGDEIVGQEIEVTVKKNKVAPPWKQATFSIMAGDGINTETDTLGAAEVLGVVFKRGSYYVYNDETIGQGKVKTINALKENPELLEAIRKECEEIFNG